LEEQFKTLGAGKSKGFLSRISKGASLALACWLLVIFVLDKRRKSDPNRKHVNVVVFIFIFI
jgi:hypothetical protein